MEPSTTILVIQNPGDAEATIINPFEALSPDSAIERFGGQIKQGAFVSLTDRDYNGNTAASRLFVVDRVGDSVYLQNNEFMADDDAPDVDDIGTTYASGHAPLEPDPEELETFTVFGNNDDNENFVAVVSATESTVHDVGVQAGLVDAGYEGDVTIVAILKGDQSDLERVSI